MNVGVQFADNRYGAHSVKKKYVLRIVAFSYSNLFHAFDASVIP